jgi:uncharacterized protein YjbI with pentapeptide repeats
LERTSKTLICAHADLARQSLFGANCEGTVFVGARLDRADFSKANLRRADQADMRRASLYTADIGSKKKPCVDFHEALVDETTDIAGRNIRAPRG